MIDRRALAVALAVALGSAKVVTAQQAHGPGPAARHNACLDAIPDSLLRRVPVYLTASLLDSTGSGLAFRDGVDLFAQTVAQTVRGLLATSEGVLPAAEPAVTWRGLGPGLLVVARRDGSVDARAKPPTDTDDVLASDVGAQLLLRAIDTLRARGDVGIVFPDSLPPDSVSWLLHLEPATLDEQGEITTPKMRVGILIFSIGTPTQRQVQVERVKVRYPPGQRSAGFMGNVTMQFVVDTAGRPDPATIRDLFPAGHPPLSNRQRAAYDEFVRAVRVALVDGRYRPAMIGGCLVRQLVQQPFSFELGNGPPP